MIDLLLKSWIFNHFEFSNVSFISLHQNSGFFLGALKETVPFIRIIILSSLLGFFFTVIYFFLYLIVEKVPLLTTGLTLFLSGISGNVVDRAYYGFVRDYIQIFNGTSFNLADIYIVTGFILVVFGLFKYGEIIWYPNTERKLKLHFSREQIVFSFKIISVLSFYFLIVILFCISFFTVYELPRNLYMGFIAGLLSLTLIFALVIFYFSCILFGKITGPLVALEKFIDDLDQGKDRDLVLRKNDYLKTLEILSTKIKKLQTKERKHEDT